MTIQQLKYAITISEVGSLNRASEVLYVSQPSLSSAVRSLEEDLGITIFSRGGKGVALTNDVVATVVDKTLTMPARWWPSTSGCWTSTARAAR